jgi:eukaryotic-like serine/threonine-protein kinase
MLYEMLTGKSLFQGEDITETLAAVIRKEPEWERIPPEVRRVLKSCLERDPRRRLHDISDASLLLDSTPSVAAQPAAPPARKTWVWKVVDGNKPRGCVGVRLCSLP